MNLLLISKDADIIRAVRDYAAAGHDLAVVRDIAGAEAELRHESHDAILMDCSIRPSELIGLAGVYRERLARSVVLLIGPLDLTQREALSRRLSAHYSIDKPLRGKAFAEAMQRVEMRATIVRKAGLIGRSPAIEETVQTIMQVGPTPINILITGESGSGKEVIARAIHAVSLRSDKPFFAVNCASLAEGVLESELFGHEKGSFTGAVARRLGMFERADGGTIFLDEIGEISPSTQIRLLRVVEEREIMRVGGTDLIPVDVRIITATNRDLAALVEQNGFRRDLYYRIKVLEIETPPLRDRREDIPLLIDVMAEAYARENGLPLRRFTDAAKEHLSAAEWPGNVRELRNVVESTLALSRAKVIDRGDIPAYLMYSPAPSRSLPVRADAFSERTEREFLYRMLLELKSDLTEIKDLLRGQYGSFDHAFRDPMAVSPPDQPREGTLEDMEREAVIEALRSTNGNRRLAAERLGIGERTLYRKLRQYDIQ